ncbi:S53 family peptidase [Phaeacidiphilus oryzae]|uniref:S53 family peptidase n=1 Tax=Phaeacidiphilus oryzae TaxID=348818 RepID=UPI000ACC13C8|nr:peptidase S8 [Phaeacidiphilus oryzae]
MHRRHTPRPERRQRRIRGPRGIRGIRGRTGAAALLVAVTTMASWGLASGAQAAEPSTGQSLLGGLSSAVSALAGASSGASHGSSGTAGTSATSIAGKSTAAKSTTVRSTAASVRTTAGTRASHTLDPVLAAVSAARAAGRHAGPDFGCASPSGADGVRCFGEFRTVRTSSGPARPATTGSPTSSGYTPSAIRSAYGLSGKSGSGRTVAIVDAFDDPKAESDLAAYRSAYGLSACTTANGCFTKVNQKGATSPMPSGDYGWAEEISLDLDMVSAACPDCHILLVEANSANSGDLMAAEDAAAGHAGVVAVSNSWGGSEDSTITADDGHFKHAGVAFTASSGDGGYGVEWPASSPNVTGVGGTSLNKASNSRGWTETAWSGAGSGCSAYEAKPSFQTDSGCAKRTVADVSAVADPNTGVAVHDTYNSCGSSQLCDTLLSLGLAQGADGWIQVGGTSAASPIIASVYALAGNTGSITPNAYPYAHRSALNDVTSGSNGSCGGGYLCTAKSGYDGPTGLGTPNGTGAF